MRRGRAPRPGYDSPILPTVDPQGCARKPNNDLLRPRPSGDRTRSSRRDFLAAQVIAAATATQSLVPSHAWAALENAADLPKDYYDAARAVVKTLTESLEFEATGPTPADRFRKAEPAKEAVKAFIKDWAASPKVQGERAHDDIVLAVRELGEFYKANGPAPRSPPLLANPSSPSSPTRRMRSQPRPRPSPNDYSAYERAPHAH